jgi:predicted transcriptional regulator
MTDRTPQQVDMTLDRVEQISAENTVNIAELQSYVSQVARAIEQLAAATDQQNQKQDERIARQDTLIQLLSAYITGTPPQAD